MRRAHQDRHIVEVHRINPARAPLHRLDLFADPARLGLPVPMADQTHLFAVFAGREQGLAQTAFVGLDHTRGGPQNMPGRAVILFQPHNDGARKILFKPQDVAHFGPAPAIDRLVVIADATDVLVPLRQQPQPHILGHVRILIFVHQNVAEPTLILLQDIVVLLKNRHHVQQQIAKIAGVQILHPLLIGRVKINALAVVGTALGHRHLARRPCLVFPAVDDARQHSRRPAFVINIAGRHQLLEQTKLIIRVQNGEIRLQPDQFRMTAEQLYTDRMERAQPRHPLDMARQRPHPRLHLARGFVGECDRQNLVRPRRSCGQQMRNPRRQRLGLARPGPCQHQHRTIQRLNRLALCGVQPVQIGRGKPRHRAGGQRPARSTRNGGSLKGFIIGITAHLFYLARQDGQENPMFALCSPHRHILHKPAVFRPRLAFLWFKNT